MRAQRYRQGNFIGRQATCTTVPAPCSEDLLGECSAILKSLVTLSLNLGFASEVQWGSRAMQMNRDVYSRGVPVHDEFLGVPGVHCALMCRSTDFWGTHDMWVLNKAQNKYKGSM